MEGVVHIENSRTFQSKSSYRFSDGAGGPAAVAGDPAARPLRRQEELVGPPRHGIFAIMVPMDFVDALGPVSAAQERLTPTDPRFRARHKKTVRSHRSGNNRFHIRRYNPM